MADSLTTQRTQRRLVELCLSYGRPGGWRPVSHINFTVRGFMKYNFYSSAVVQLNAVSSVSEQEFGNGITKMWRLTLPLKCTVQHYNNMYSNSQTRQLHWKWVVANVTSAMDQVRPATEEEDAQHSAVVGAASLPVIDPDAEISVQGTFVTRHVSLTT